MKTLQERYIAALQKQGEREVKRTSRYIVYTRDDLSYYYIGKSGSLRVGARIASSIPVSQNTKNQLLASLNT